MRVTIWLRNSHLLALLATQLARPALVKVRNSAQLAIHMLKSSHDLPVVRAANAVLVSTNHPQLHSHALHAINHALHALEIKTPNVLHAMLVRNFSRTAVASLALAFALIAMIPVSTVLLAVLTLTWPQLMVQRPMNILVFAMITSGLRMLTV